VIFGTIASVAIGIVAAMKKGPGISRKGLLIVCVTILLPIFSYMFILPIEREIYEVDGETVRKGSRDLINAESNLRYSFLRDFSGKHCNKDYGYDHWVENECSFDEAAIENSNDCKLKEAIPLNTYGIENIANISEYLDCDPSLIGEGFILFEFEKIERSTIIYDTKGRAYTNTGAQSIFFVGSRYYRKFALFLADEDGNITDSLYSGDIEWGYNFVKPPEKKRDCPTFDEFERQLQQFRTNAAKNAWTRLMVDKGCV